jgi:hypothetical protein
MATVTTTIDLDASTETVWAVLTGTEQYREWNPFIRQLDGELKAGSRLTVRIQLPGGKPMTFRPTVTEVQPARRLAWLGRFGLPGLFDGAHSFTLQQLEPGHTRLTQSESFSGVLVAFSRRVLRNTEAGFHIMNAALKKRLVLAESPEL